MTDFALARRNMVDGQFRPNRVTNSQLLAAIGALPARTSCPTALRSVAYSDEDVPLGNGRFLMEPMVLARLIQTLQPRETEPRPGGGLGPRLWRGTARLVKSVVAVESDAALSAAAERTAKELGLAGIEQRSTAGGGAAASAPYDVILIEGAVRQVPPAILEQLVDGGRMATIVAGRRARSACAQLFVKEGGVASGRAAFRCRNAAVAGLRAAAALHLLIAAVGQLRGLSNPN